MLPFLLLALIAVPIAELALIVAIGTEIGLGWTVVLLVGDAVLGSLVIRWQGRSAWRQFAAAVRAGRPPAREVLDGAMVLVGGALLLTPGFVTDAFGLALLLPPSRAVIRGFLARRVVVRMAAQMSTPRPARRGGGVPRDHDVEGTAHDLDGPGLGAPPR